MIFCVIHKWVLYNLFRKQLNTQKFLLQENLICNFCVDNQWLMARYLMIWLPAILHSAYYYSLSCNKNFHGWLDQVGIRITQLSTKLKLKLRQTAMQTAYKKRKYSLIFTFIFSSANFYLNFPTGKDFGKLSFLQKNLAGGAHRALEYRYMTLQP